MPRLLFVLLRHVFRISSVNLWGSIDRKRISASVVCKNTPSSPHMPDLSSLKWGDDGELSPNDTLSYEKPKGLRHCFFC